MEKAPKEMSEIDKVKTEIKKISDMLAFYQEQKEAAKKDKSIDRPAVDATVLEAGRAKLARLEAQLANL